MSSGGLGGVDARDIECGEREKRKRKKPTYKLITVAWTGFNEDI